MHPYIAGTIPVYPVALLSAVIVSAVIGLRSLRQANLSLRVCLRIQLVMTCTGVLGAKLYSLLERDGTLFSLRQEMTQGYRYPGAIIALVVVTAIWGRRLSRGTSLGALGDALAPSIGVGAAVLRIGCYLYGCCFGLRSDLPWAVTFPSSSPAWHAHVGAGWIDRATASSLPIHPLQLYFIAVSLGAAGFAWWLQRRKSFDGQVLLTFLMIDGIGKGLLEAMRAARPPSVQAASLAIGVLAGTALIGRSLSGPKFDAAQSAGAVGARKLFRFRLYLCLVLSPAFLACAPAARIILPDPVRLEDINAVLRRAPLAAGENIKALPLQRGEHSSVTLVQIRDRETPHRHTRYDIMVLLLRGKGTLHVGDRALPMRAGDVSYITKGIPHYFVNEGSEPAVALVTFAPAFDGPDQEPL